MNFQLEGDSNQNKTRTGLKMRAVKVTSGVWNYYYLIKIINITKWMGKIDLNFQQDFFFILRNTSSTQALMTDNNKRKNGKNFTF
jgi:hypothetical protein